MNGQTLDPKDRSASADQAVRNWQRQLTRAREVDMVVAYANAVHRNDGADGYARVTDTNFRGNRIPAGQRHTANSLLSFGSEAADFRAWLSSRSR